MRIRSVCAWEPISKSAGQVEIVGVLRDAKYDSVRDEAPPTLYVPYLQTRVFAPTFALRTAGDPLAMVAAIRETVRSIDPNVPILDVFTQMEQVERRFLQEKMFAQAYTLVRCAGADRSRPSGSSA